MLESEPVADSSGARLSWMLVAASVLFVVLLLYVMFVGYLPAKQRVTELERELKAIYEREAELQTKLQQQDGKVKRLEQLERELVPVLKKP